MAPKKKAGGDKKKKEGDEEDLSVENFWKAYKKKCVEYNCDVSKIIKGAMEKFFEEGDEIKKLHMWEELGWPGVKAIVESLIAAKYPHMVSIRLWKTYCEDEGVRILCTFLEQCSSILCLELLDNKVTYLGCEFLGKTLTPGPKCPPICILKLDHNNFGSRGLNALLKGIQSNEFLKTLSFAYCGIDAEASRGLFEMLIFSKSHLEELILTGNNLRNEGAIMVLQGVSAAKELKKIYLADNQFNEADEMLEAIKKCMTRNKNLARYDFRNNDLKDKGKCKITVNIF